MKKMLPLFCACAMALGVASACVHAQTPEDDKKFLATAAQSDVNEIKISELAEQKATDPRVKAFAAKMVKEHEALEVKMKPFATEWGLQTPPDMDDDHKDEYKKLSGLSGHDFDKEYIDAMVKDHTKALDLFTDEVKETKNAKFKTAVMAGKSHVAAHKNMAWSLQKKL